MTTVAVVGAGLLGSAVADELAGAGARVTVLEAGRPGGGTSGASFAWINAQDKAPTDYFELNAEGVAAYPALARSLGGDWYHPGGDLAIGRGSGAAKVAGKLERHRALGYPVRELDRAAVLALEPGLELPSDREFRAAHFPDEAWIDAPQLVERRLARAAGFGALVRVASAVTGFDRVGDRVTGARTDSGAVAADIVVLAAGPASEGLAGLAGVRLPMSPSPGLLATTEPAEVTLSHVVHDGDVAIRPDGPGRILLSSREVDASLDPSIRELAPDSAPCDELLARARRLVPALRGVRVDRVRVGVRSVASDGLPVAGYAPGIEGLYLLVAHSGATLAAALGRLVASELLGHHEGKLESWRPARFG
jgi:glycine/D-amino acid oxidase-like deaminating enzyme